MMPRLTDQEYRPFSPFGRGIGSLGGGLDQAFNPLKGFLSQTIAEEQVEPFVDEVKQMAQERFDLNGNAFQPQILQPRMVDEIGVPRGLQENLFNRIMQKQPSIEARQLEALGRAEVSAFADGGPVMGGLGSFLASNLDEFGRNGDTELVHMAKQEVAVHPNILKKNPELRKQMEEAFAAEGRDMAEFTVGSGEMNVNPITGYEEAFEIDFIGGIKDIFKKAAPFLLPAAVSFLFPGMSPFVSGALAGGVGSLLQGGDLGDAFKAGLTGGLTSAATTGLMKGSLSAGFKGDPTYEPFQMRKFGEAAVDRPSVTLEGKAKALADPQSALSSGYEKAKTFFTDPKMEVSQLAKDAGIDLATASDATKLDLLAKANQSGGINYARAIPAGIGALALAGGFDPIEEDPPEDPYPYTTRELLDMYPERYRTGRIIAPIRMAAKGGEMEFPRRQGYIAGPGTETSDDIPAMLSDGEFVMTARAVRGAGDGSRKKGVEKMYDIMRAFEGGVVA